MYIFTVGSIKNYIGTLNLDIPILQTYIEYVYFFLNPYYNQIKNAKNTNQIKKIMSNWMGGSVLMDVEDKIEDIHNEKIKTEEFIEEIMNMMVWTIIGQSLIYRSGYNVDFEKEYKKVRGDTPLSPDDFFMGVFSDKELR